MRGKKFEGIVRQRAISCSDGHPRPFASNNLGRNSPSGFHRRLAPLANPDNLIQNALRHFPLRGLGDLDDLVVGNDRHFIAVGVETDTFAGDVVDHDSIEVFVGSSSSVIGPLRFIFCPETDFAR